MIRKRKLRRKPQQKQKLSPHNRGARAAATVGAEVETRRGWKQMRRLRLSVGMSGPWDVVVEEVACGANGTTQLAPSRRYTREEAGSERVALPYEGLVVWVTGGRGCRASLV